MSCRQNVNKHFAEDKTGRRKDVMECGVLGEDELLAGR